MATDTLTKPESRYADDAYAWTLEQTALLQARRLDELDVEHLVEALDDLADSMKKSVSAHTITITVHLLKLQHSPATYPRGGWRHTIRLQRVHLSLELTRSLRRELADELGRLYRLARGVAEGDLRDYGEHAAADALPAACPYTLDQITGDWWP